MSLRDDEAHTELMAPTHLNVGAGRSGLIKEGVKKYMIMLETWHNILWFPVPERHTIVMRHMSGYDLI